MPRGPAGASERHARAPSLGARGRTPPCSQAPRSRSRRSGRLVILTPRRNGAITSSLASLLECAIQSRANVLLEGSTELVRAVLAQGIHARSQRGSGRIYASLRIDSAGDEIAWPEVLAGNVGAFLEVLGIRIEVDPAAMGTLHLEGLSRLSPQRQAALGLALRERDDLLFGASRGPRIIGGTDETATAAAGLDQRLRRALAVVHVQLGPPPEWQSLVQEWTVEEPPESSRTVRLEWW